MTQQFVGPYRVVQKLGSGGMGEVYLAEDPRLGRKVALKKPSGAWLRLPGARGRLQQEASAAAGLSHPNIAAVYDVLDPGDAPYIVMEYVEGETLANVLRRGPLPVEQVVHVGIQLADVLSAAHQKGIIHRDIKPGNVCLRPDGSIKVLDFGLANAPQLAAASDSGAGGRLSGRFLGTPGYCSPEQLAGAPPRPGDDIYAAGALLFELLTGHRPFEQFEGDALALAAKTLTHKAPDVASANPSVPVELSRLVARMLAPDARDRVASATEVQAELRHISTNLAGSPTRALFAGRVVSGRRRIGGLLLLAMLVAVAGALLVVRPREPAVTADGVPVLAILPFENRTGDVRDQAIASGMRDVLTANLAGQPDINVVSRSEVADTAAEPHAGRLARRLGADFLVRGSVQRSGGTLLVAVRLEGPGGAVAWGDTYSASEEDLLVLQHRIAEGLAASPPLRGAAGGARRAGTSGARNVEALRHYGEAVSFLERPDIPGNLKRAEQLLRTALERDPEFALAWARLGETHWALFEQTRDKTWTEKAVQAITEALRRDPDQPEVRISLARVYSGMGRSEAAIEELKKALALQPRNSDAHRLLGQVLQQIGRTDEAAEEYRKAIAARPNYWRSYNMLGGLHYAAGRYEDALAAFMRVTELQPDSARGFHNVGTVHYLMGDNEQALAFYSKALALSPMPETYSNIGNIYYHQGRYQEAADAFRQAIGALPNNGLLHGNLGDAYIRLNRQKDALRAYAEAVRLDHQLLGVNPNDPAILARVAVNEAKLGRHADADRHRARAVELRRDGETLYRSAAVRALTGDTEGALADLEQALEQGYSAAVAARDHDLAAIRGTREFRELMAAH